MFPSTVAANKPGHALGPPLETEVPLLVSLHEEREARGNALECIIRNPHLAGRHIASCLALLVKRTIDESERSAAIKALAGIDCGLPELIALASDARAVASSPKTFISSLTLPALRESSPETSGLERLLANPALSRQDAQGVADKLILSATISGNLSATARAVLYDYLGGLGPEDCGEIGYKMVPVVAASGDLELARVLLERHRSTPTVADRLLLHCAGESGREILRLIALMSDFVPQRTQAIQRYLLDSSPDQVAQVESLLGGLLQTSPEIFTADIASRICTYYFEAKEISLLAFKQLGELIRRGALSPTLLMYRLNERQGEGYAERMIEVVQLTPEGAARAQACSLLTALSSAFSPNMLQRYLGDDPPFEIHQELRVSVVLLLQRIAVDRPELRDALVSSMRQERLSSNAEVAAAARLGLDTLSRNPFRRIRAIFGMLHNLTRTLETWRKDPRDSKNS